MEERTKVQTDRKKQQSDVAMLDARQEYKHWIPLCTTTNASSQIDTILTRYTPAINCVCGHNIYEKYQDGGTQACSTAKG